MPSRRLIARTVTAVIAVIVVPLAAIHYYRHFYYHTDTVTATQKQAEAGGKMSDAVPKPPPPQQIIVVGAGLAGLAAAHAALTASSTASVLLLERAAKPGGNSIKASSGINGVPTRFQDPSAGDSVERFRDDTARSAGVRLSSAPPPDRRGREALIATLADRSAAAVHWLHDVVGVDLSVVAQLGGHSAARTHRGAGKTPPGFAIVSALVAKLKDEVGKDRFELRTGCEVTKLLTAPSTSASRVVTGVEFTHEGSGDGDATIAHGPVIFATGGFAGDAVGLLARHRPDLGSLPSTNDAHAAVGHGVLERDAGAALVDMDSVQVHPTGFVDPANRQAPVKILAAELLRGEGGILLRDGKRFVNEMDTREKVSAAVMAVPPAAAEAQDQTPQPRQWDVQLLLDPGACDAAANHVGFYLFKGLLAKRRLGDLDARTRQTVREYAAVAAGKASDPLGRTVFGHWKLTPDAADDGQVCIGSVTPITHFTMGGAAINERAQVLAAGAAAAASAPVEGLWAAGEITGGLHGDNRLGGSSLLECVVFGRIAGEEAARYVEAK